MEKYDNIVKSSEIRKLVEKKMYQKALAIIDTMDVSKIRVMTDLSVFAEVYIQTERYEDAKDLLLRLHDRTKSRRIVYQLIRLAIKEKDIEDAEYFYEEYVHIAPKDSEKYILRYRIDRMRDEDVSVLIRSLEELKEHDYIEKWSYELAKLYHVAGMKDECIRECSDIILWFGEGIIVEKAKLLKEHYVGKPKYIEAIKTAEKRAIEEKTGMLETKDLSKMTENLKKVLEEIETEDEKEHKVEHEKETDSKTELKSYEQVEEDDETIIPEPDFSEQNLSEPVVEEATCEPAQSEAMVSEPEVSEVVTPEQEEPEPILSEPVVEEAIEPEMEQEEELEQDSIEESAATAEIVIDIERYRALFESFFVQESIEEEICEYIKIAEQKEERPHVIISGTNTPDKLSLAKLIAKVCFDEALIGTTRIAKINAHRLNRIDLSQNYDKITDVCIIVDEAGSLSNKAIVQLIVLIETLGDKVIVILEDTREGIEKLEKFPQLLSNFKSHIRLENQPKLELLPKALKSLSDDEYDIGDEAKNALQEGLDRLLTSHSGNVTDEILNDYMQTIKDHADRRNMNQLKDVVSERNYLNVDLNEVISEDIESV